MVHHGEWRERIGVSGLGKMGWDIRTKRNGVGYEV